MKQSQLLVGTKLPTGTGAPTRLLLETFLPHRLAVLSSCLAGALAESCWRRFGLGVPEWRVVAVLGCSAPLSATEVSARSSMDRVKVSRAIARLEARGLVCKEAHPEDHRRVRLWLSMRGRAVHDDVVSLALGFEAAFLDGLTARQRRSLEEAVGTLEDRVRLLRTDASSGDAAD